MTENNYKNDYISAFGKELKKIRLKANKSLRLLAFEADVPCATLSRLENGSRIANILTLKKLASALNIQLADFIRQIEDNLPDEVKNIEL